MPAQIAYENTRLGLTGNAAFPKPIGYGIAPTGELTRAHVGHLLVGATVWKVPNGTRAFRNAVSLQIYMVGERAESEAQTLFRHDLAELVFITLQPYLVGCVDPQGRECWRELTPDGVSPLPGDWKQFSGLTLNLQLTQSPADTGWDAT